MRFRKKKVFLNILPPQAILANLLGFSQSSKLAYGQTVWLKRLWSLRDFSNKLTQKNRISGEKSTILLHRELVKKSSQISAAAFANRPSVERREKSGDSPGTLMFKLQPNLFLITLTLEASCWFVHRTAPILRMFIGRCLATGVFCSEMVCAFESFSWETFRLYWETFYC